MAKPKPSILKKKLGIIHDFVGKIAIAIVVMIVLVVFVFPLFYGTSGERKTVARELEAIAEALGRYKSEKGQWPETTNAMVSAALVGNSPSGAPWLKHDRRDEQGRLLDPWNHPFQFFLSNDGFIVRSPGEDGTFTKGPAKSAKDDFYYYGR